MPIQCQPINPPKIDDLAVTGLSGTYNSLAYRVHEIEKHLHNSEQVFGNASNTMAADTPVKFTVVGGNDAWGTELLLTDGTVIESGSTTKKFDLNKLYITDVSAANKISVVDILYELLAMAVEAVTITAANDLFTKEGHGLSDGDKIVLSSIVDTTGINAYTVYYVVGVAGNDFQVALTSGGSAVALTTDGSCSFRKLTQSEGTKFVVSMANTNSDAMPYQIMMPRVPCNYALSIRAKSESGQTISIGFLIGLHIYSN
jgi:hypothetical protein